MSSLHEVMQQITKCRKAGEVSYSNFYPGDSMDTEYQMVAGKKTVVFWRKKEGVFRVYFHTADLEELKVLLKETPEHAVIDYLCREGDAPFEAIEKGGYHHYATYLKRQIQVEAEEKIPEGKVASFFMICISRTAGNMPRNQMFHRFMNFCWKTLICRQTIFRRKMNCCRL